MKSFASLICLVSMLYTSCSESTNKSGQDQMASVASEECLSSYVTVQVPLEENQLPQPILQTISNNAVFSNLKLVKAIEIAHLEQSFYDLAFEDEEQFIIRAKFDSEGKLIPYDNHPVEVAQP